MPWHIEKGHSGCSSARPYAVVKDADGEVEGCHPTRTRAERQMRALYANEPAVSVKQFNAAIERARDQAFGVEEALITVYEAAFLAAGRKAEEAFRRATFIVAAGEWVPPPKGDLWAEGETSPGDEERASAASAFGASLGLPDLFNEESLQIIAKRSGEAFDEAMNETLSDIITESFDSGASVRTTADAIQDRFVGVARYRAEMLARTDLNTLANAASQIAAMKTFVGATVYKKWITAHDARVRKPHAEAEGQTVPLSQPFRVGGFELMYPGDVSAPISLTANCRCTQIYEESLTAAASTLGGNPMSNVTDTSVGIFVPNVVYTTNGTNTSTAAVTFTVDEQREEKETDLSSLSWRAVLALEGTSTDDGRYFASDAWSWRDVPLSLMAQTVNEEGHRGAEIAGRIDRIWKEAANQIEGLEDLPDGVVAVLGEGEFDSGEFGREVARMVSEKTLRGISVDFGVSEAALYDPETDEVFSPEDREISIEEMMFGSKYHIAALAAEIGAATVVSFPAFADAAIAMTASGLPTQITILEGTVLTAGAAGMAPLKPPRSWFEDPQLEGPTPLTVSRTGRVYGHAALFDTCHIGDPFGPGICVPPPRSSMNYSVFHHGVCETDDGVEVPCGQITLGTPHASRDLSWRETIAHYENTGMAVADVRAGEDKWGIWVAGGLRPTVSANKVREMKGGAISGDWRDIRGKLEFLAALVVNVAGYPIPRPEARVIASATGEEHVLALVAAGIVTEETSMGPREARRRAKVLSQRARKSLAR